MKVYIVVQGENYEGYNIVDVFLNKEEAKELKEKLEKEICYDCDYVDIEECEVK